MSKNVRPRSRAPRKTSRYAPTKNRYQQIFEIAQEGLWTLDQNDRISLVNRRMAEMLGYPIDELVGRSVFDFMDEENQEIVRKALIRRRSGLGEKYDLRLTRKDGAPMWGHVSGSPIFGRHGRYAGALAMVSDITARKEAEENLRRSEERFALLAKATKDVIFESEFTKGGLWFSESIREAFGYHEGSFDLQWWLDRIHPDDLSRMSQISRELREGRRDMAATEYRFRRSDGTYADVFSRGYVIRNAEGEPTRMVGAMMDFTERNAAQRAVVESQRRLQALFDNAMDAILLMNDDGHFIEGNASAAQLLGYPIDEIKHLHFTDLTPPPSDQQAWDLWRDFQIKGRQVHEFAIRSKDGRAIEIEYCAVRGIQPGINLVIVRDISARKRAERTLEENHARLEALSSRVVHAQEDERGRIARELHDQIGQTLTAVKLGLDAIERRSDGSQAEQITEARQAVELALHQVRDLSLGLRPLILDDLGLVATLRWYLDSQARKNGLSIHFSSSLVPDRLSADVETACFRIVQEALTNVIRHSGAHDLWVDLQKGAAHQVELTVKDNGKGFDTAAMLNRWYSTANLGLVGMQERVRLLGGSIDIASRRGEGTEIRVRFDCPSLLEAEG